MPIGALFCIPAPTGQERKSERSAIPAKLGEGVDVLTDQLREHFGGEAFVGLPNRGGVGVERAPNDHDAFDAGVTDLGETIPDVLGGPGEGEPVDERAIEELGVTGLRLTVAVCVVARCEPARCRSW
jgi:hypothetical protein